MLWNNGIYKNEEPVKVLGLFSGGGGLDLGFSQAGFSVCFSNDIDENFCKTIKQNTNYFSNSHQVLRKDIHQLVPDEILEQNIDFFIGGPPCQSFSAAGRRAGGSMGIKDNRGSLFREYCRILSHFKPKGFLFENVKGIISSNRKQDWEEIKNEFRNLGYKLFYRLLDAAEYGVPQHRERLILVGLKDGIFKFPKPTHGPRSTKNNQYVSAEESIADLQDASEKIIPYGGKYGDLLMQVPPGLNYSFFTEKRNHPNPKFAWRSRFSDFLYVADPQRPTKTIVAKQGKYGGPFHWNKRKFRFNEFKRLFSFPDDYDFYGSETSKMEQLGNSVPPSLGRVLGLSIMKQVFNKKINIELMDDNYKTDIDERKRVKAQITRSSVKQNKYSNKENSIQFELFKKEKEIINKKMNFEFDWTYKGLRNKKNDKHNKDKYEQKYQCNAHLNNGEWRCSLKKLLSSNNPFKIYFELTFSEAVNRSFKNIIVDFKSDNIHEIGVAWDLVNFCICKSTSYDAVDKLYGHFTEPYPKFDLKIVNKSKINDPIINFMQKISDFEFLAREHKYCVLREFGFKTDEEIATIKVLRDMGFDIRTHFTNRAISEGRFRVVYPFTKPLNQSSFIKWKETLV